MSCEYCEDAKYRMIRLEDLIEDLRKEIREERNACSKVESEVRRLKPYEDAAKRSYDAYVTDPERAER